MTTHEINLLIERYLDGETTLAEERELALAVQREDRPAEWAIIAEMLGELTADEAIYDEIMAQRAPKPAKRLTKLWPWAAAACIAVALGLSYNIIKEEPQEMAKAPQQLSATPDAPSNPVLSCDWSHDNAPAPSANSPKTANEVPTATSTARLTAPPLAMHQEQQTPMEQPPAEKTLLRAQAEEPLHEPPADQPLLEPQLIAEVEAFPPSEDLALCMALLAEVEARAVMLQQTHPQPLPEGGRGEVTTPINGLSEYTVSTPLPHKEGQGVGLLLLDELLANIQQQSNRPELSL